MRIDLSFSDIRVADEVVAYADSRNLRSRTRRRKQERRESIPHISNNGAPPVRDARQPRCCGGLGKLQDYYLLSYLFLCADAQSITLQCQPADSKLTDSVLSADLTGEGFTVQLLLMRLDIPGRGRCFAFVRRSPDPPYSGESWYFLILLRTAPSEIPIIVAARVRFHPVCCSTHSVCSLSDSDPPLINRSTIPARLPLAV